MSLLLSDSLSSDINLILYFRFSQSLFRDSIKTENLLMYLLLTFFGKERICSCEFSYDSVNVVEIPRVGIVGKGQL